MALKPETISVINYLKEHADINVTAKDLADILGLSQKQVDGIFTRAIQCKGYGERIPAEVEKPDGTHKAVKFLKLTQEGMKYDPTAQEQG